MNRPHARRFRPLVGGLVAAVLVLGLGAAGLATERASHRDSQRSEAVTIASRVRADLEKALEARIFQVEGVAGYAVADLADGSIDDDAFQAYAASLLRDSDVPVRSLQLAPDGVVTHVHPLAGNEAALGHDLLEDPARREAVMAAVALRSPMVAGPFELLQGGTAIVVRKPVFLDGTDDWWGLATMVADVGPLFAEVGLDGSDPTLAAYDIALRGVDQSGAQGAAFLGSDEVFAPSAEPVAFDVTLPAGSWQLGLRPAGGWDQWPWPREDAYLFAVLGLALVLGLLVGRYVASREEAREAAEGLAQVLTTAATPIAGLDGAGRIRHWNPGMEQLTGVDADDAVGTNLLEPEASSPLARTLTPSSLAALAAVLRSGSEAGRASDELQIARVDGSAVPVLADVARTRTGSDMVLVLQDLTSQVEATRAQAENAATQEAARLKDEFLASMSHELRTPLNGVIGLSSILERETFGTLNEKQAEYVRQIGASGHHLLALINDVLDLAKMEADGVDVALLPVDVASVVRDSTTFVRQTAHAKGLHLSVDLPDAPVVAPADARRLKQILLNLLSNAVKFTPRGGEVAVALTTSHDHVVVAVSDTGIGIAEDKLGLLFRPFQQVEAALNRPYEGSGLGLALSAKLAELHGGEITVESLPGHGSTFALRLPLAATPSAQVAPVRRDTSPVAEDARTTRRLDVVVAEDNDVNRTLLVDLLASHGMDVREARDGVEVVEVVARQAPDVVLMDVQMPGRDGLAATRILKQSPSTAHVPVVALTALAMPGDVDRCLDAGCDAYLAKPVDLDLLVSTILELTTEAVGA